MLPRTRDFVSPRSPEATPRPRADPARGSAYLARSLVHTRRERELATTHSEATLPPH